MTDTEAKQTLSRINEMHFLLNPEPLTEEQKQAYRKELEFLRLRLIGCCYTVALVHGESLESCGRYVIV